MTGTGTIVAHNVSPLGRLDIAGGGQVVVEGDLAFIGHMDPPHGTTIVDVSDPARPRPVARLEMPPHTHSHKVRVAGDIMVINNENTRRHLMAAGNRLPEERARLTGELGRPPTDAELARALNNYRAEDIPALIEAAAQGFDGGGIRIFDISDPSAPAETAFFKTGGNGVHRFDFDGHYAYLSTRMDGYQGNIVLIVDLADPAEPREVSRWWLPGQWTAGGEQPDWGDQRYECHHPLHFGDRLYVSYCMAGMIILDIADIAAPRRIGGYNYHPPFFKTHTIARMPFRLDGRDIAVVIDEQPPRPRPGQVPAFMWVFDVTDETDPRPLSAYTMSEADTPWKMGDLKPGDARFGAHQCHEKMTDSLVYVAWFRGGLRIVDIRDPARPVEVGYFIPKPGKGAPTVQSNDVFVDGRGRIYLLDRFAGLEILEYTGPPGQQAP